ncbi:sugar ABC transporter ATP-binding protein [candidate division KSB1 bacterium]
MRQKILEMTGISKNYSGVRALNNVNFELEIGEVHTLTGFDGAGKTTLIKILSGLEKMDSGKIRIYGREVNITSTTVAKNLGISTVFHEYKLIDYFSIAENIFLGREPIYNRLRLINRRILKTRARVILDILGLKRDVNTLVEKLDASEKKMIEIAKSLSFDAKIIAIDEPTSTLSEKEIDNLFKLIRTLKIKGISIIYLSHRIDEIYKVGDRVSILRDGILIDTKFVKNIRRGELVRKMSGMDEKQEFPNIKSKKEEEVIKLVNISGGCKVKNVNLEIFKKELLGISGLDGSGKSELARIISGVDKKESGCIYLDGKEVKINSPADAIKLGIGFLTEDKNIKDLIPGLTIAGNITITNLKSITKWGLLRREKEEDITINYLKEFNINLPNLNGKINNLSEGDKQKILIARSLFANLKVIIFDEPTKGVDLRVKTEIYEFINNLIKKGIAVVIISSELPEIIGMCDRIAVMRKGKIEGILQKKDVSYLKIMNLACD